MFSLHEIIGNTKKLASTEPDVGLEVMFVFFNYASKSYNSHVPQSIVGEQKEIDVFFVYMKFKTKLLHSSPSEFCFFNLLISENE